MVSSPCKTLPDEKSFYGLSFIQLDHFPNAKLLSEISPCDNIVPGKPFTRNASEQKQAKGYYRNFNSSSLNDGGRRREGVWLFIDPNTSMFVKNTPLRVFFSSLFWVLENAINHRLSSLRYYLYDVNVATVSWFYQILTTLHIS